MLNTNTCEIEIIKQIAGSADDGPVLMLNLNKYYKDAGYPDQGVYQEYMSFVPKLLDLVGAKIIWQVPTLGQPVGEQDIDEIIAFWYPSHRAFLDLTKTELSEKNFDLRRRAIEYGVIHRCPDDVIPKPS